MFKIVTVIKFVMVIILYGFFKNMDNRIVNYKRRLADVNCTKGIYLSRLYLIIRIAYIGCSVYYLINNKYVNIFKVNTIFNNTVNINDMWSASNLIITTIFTYLILIVAEYICFEYIFSKESSKLFENKTNIDK